MADPDRFKRLRVFSSHSGYWKWCDESRKKVGVIQTPEWLSSPYMSSPTKLVSEWRGHNVIASEVRHRRYEVYEVPTGTRIFINERECIAAVKKEKS